MISNIASWAIVKYKTWNVGDAVINGKVSRDNTGTGNTWGGSVGNSVPWSHSITWNRNNTDTNDANKIDGKS